MMERPKIEDIREFPMFHITSKIQLKELCNYALDLESHLQQEREKRQQAEADNAGIDAKYRNAIGVIEKAILDGNINYMGFQNQIDAFIQYAAKPHPGAALLEEVERLRKENANYKDIVGLSCEEYRIHRETIEQYKEALILACEELVRHAGGSPFADSTWRQHFLAKAKEAE